MYLGCFSLLGMNLFFEDQALLTTLFMMMFVGGMSPMCSLLFPYSMSHLPADLQGNAQAMIQAMRLLFASCGTFLLSIVYKGPLLPVTLILMVYLVVSTLLLWIGRRFLLEPPKAVLNMGH